ncbi:MAG: alpha/beta hydrolase [Pseudomonadota bacterium]
MAAACKTVIAMELVNLVKNPVPAGASAGHFQSFDGAPIRFATWKATRRPSLGTICLFGGRTEFIEKYFEVIADLRRRGFSVATMDWRGQGGSVRELANRRKGHITTFADYDRDLVRFMKEIVLPDCPPPYIALAHSMGGNIMLRAARMRDSWFERMILTAPMVQLTPEMLGTPEWVARAYAQSITLLRNGSRYVRGGRDDVIEAMPYEDNPLTSDRERFDRAKAVLAAAPELSIGAPTVAWLNAAFRSMAEITSPRYPLDVRVPILFFAAAEDKIVSPRAIEDLSVRLKVGAHVVLPHAEHEILMERDSIRQQFWAAFDAHLGCGSHAEDKAAGA